ncbi:MAG: hypothetical protein ACK48B_06765 [Dolichospermum sp.]
MNHETLVVRASCPLDMYLITPVSAVYLLLNRQPTENRTLVTGFHHCT